MQRVTVTLDDDLMAELDAIIAERGYQNRSEAIRDLARAGIKEAAPDSGRGRDCVAALVYVYDHEARQLSKRLVRAFTISTSCRSPRCMCISTMTLASRSRCCAASRARCSISASTSSPSAACVTASWCACRSKLPPLRVEAAIVRIIIITIMTRWRPSPQRRSENVVGPMPPYGEIIGTEDDIWKIIAWIRSKHCEQDPARC